MKVLEAMVRAYSFDLLLLVTTTLVVYNQRFTLHGTSEIWHYFAFVILGNQPNLLDVLLENLYPRVAMGSQWVLPVDLLCCASVAIFGSFRWVASGVPIVANCMELALLSFSKPFVECRYLRHKPWSYGPIAVLST